MAKKNKKMIVKKNPLSLVERTYLAHTQKRIVIEVIVKSIQQTARRRVNESVCAWVCARVHVCVLTEIV